jgi:hypothetical protein
MNITMGKIGEVYNKVIPALKYLIFFILPEIKTNPIPQRNRNKYPAK